MRTFTLIASIVVAIGVLAVGLVAWAGQSTPAPASKDNFTGKWLILKMKDDSVRALENAQARKLADRWFIVGNTPIGSEVGGRGQLWLPFDDVKVFAELSDHDEFNQSLREALDQQRVLKKSPN
jgi:hypothetical protein